jgi:rhodanese-related sulfurtransferase
LNLLLPPAGHDEIANGKGLTRLLENPQTVLVDVREPAEYRSEHIPKAINIQVLPVPTVS